MWNVLGIEGIAATWGFEVEPASDGVLIRQWARLGPGTSGLTIGIANQPNKEARIVARRLSEWLQNMQANREWIRSHVETVTVTAPAPATVTITQPKATPGVNIEPINGPFQSPSGNIRCTTFDSDGRNTVRCEVVEHVWQAPPRSPDCQLNWGDRVELTEDGAAVFSCYGQNLPDPQATLDYGKVATFGSISCTSETVGIMCLDNDTGHFFNVSRDAYQVG
ncbi:hypothetical protein MGAD_51800 [Mycolicibacterium gadium]|uniref:Uncharacterized protein n=1 Tax=Mycolicibacterium gadium TaxID=1794 RepID=A0A7I7WVL9_MYCGU|nr:hypothetical protein MGAD_51800 [Mycolicibacterium gadium]